MERNSIYKELRVGIQSYTIQRSLCWVLISICINFTFLLKQSYAQCPIANNIAICNSGADPVRLNTLLLNNPPPGEWFWAGQGESPSGFNANTGRFNPEGIDAGAYTFGFNYEAHGNCIQDGTTFAIVNVMPTPIAGEGLQILACNESNLIELSSLLVGAQMGGTWVEGTTNPSGGIFEALSGTFNPVSADGNYTFIYELDTGTCPIQEATVTIDVITHTLETGLESNLKVCSDTEEKIDLHSLLEGEDQGGIWQQLPSNSSGGTFEPDGNFSVEGASTTPPNNVYGFSYSFPNCSGESIVYLTINERKNTGTASDLTVCVMADDIDLFTLLTDSPDVGGTWIPSQTLGFTSPATFSPSAVAGSTGVYEFSYEFSNTEGCGEQATSVNITVIDQPEVGIDGDAYICLGGISSINLFDIITEEEQVGQWTDLQTNNIVDNPNSFDISGLIEGVYQYEYQTDIFDGCLQTGSSIATLIIEGPQPDPGPGGFVLSCQGIVDLTGDGTFISSPGGQWIDLDLSGLDLTNPLAVDVSSLNVGTYSFAYFFGAPNGCQEAEAIVTLDLVNDPPFVTEDVTTELCESNSTNLDLFTLMGNTQRGGQWFDENNNEISSLINIEQLQVDGSQNISYTYEIGADQNCSQSSAALNLTLWELHSAGQNLNLQVCAGSGNLDLFDLIPEIETGGTWSVTGANSNFIVLDNTDGILDYSNALPGSYFVVYTQEENGACAMQQSILTLTISNDIQQLQDPLTLSVCEGSTRLIDLHAVIASNGASDGGLFDLIQGDPNAINLSTGIFNPTGLTNAQSMILEYSFEGDCSIPAQMITIEIGTELNPGKALNLTICKDANTAATVNFWSQLSDHDFGGQWIDDSGSGLDLSDPSMVDISGLRLGNYSFSYQFFGTDECENSKSSFVLSHINEEPIQGYNISLTLCEGDEMIFDLNKLLTIQHTGGNWVDLDGSGVNLSDPSAVNFSLVSAGVYTYSYIIDVIGNCSPLIESSLKLIIDESGDAGDDTFFTLCGELSTQAAFALDTGGDQGGIWEINSTNPPGSVFDNGEFFPANAFPGTYEFTYRFDNNASCESSESTVIVYVIEGLPIAESNGNAITVCEGKINTVNLNEALTADTDLGGIWSISFGTNSSIDFDLNVTTGIVETSQLEAGTYLFDYSFENTLCGEQITSSSVSLIVEGSAVGTDGVVTICDHGDAVVDLVSALGIDDTPPGSIWTDLTGTSVNLSNPHAVDFSFLPIGSYQFKLNVDPTQVVCSSYEPVVTVYINNQPSAGIGSSHEVCLLNVDVIELDLNSLITGNDPGGKWSGPQLQDGGEFNPQTGVLTLTSTLNPRTFVYTYSFEFGEESPCESQSTEVEIRVTNNCAQTTPCLAAQRYNAGSAWKNDKTIDDSSNIGGIVKCGVEGSFMTLQSPTYSYDPSNFKIEFHNQQFYNPHTGYFMSPDLPQLGEDIIWVNFDVRELVSSFQFLLEDDEQLAWALYLSNDHLVGTTNQQTTNNNTNSLSGNCSSLSFVRSGFSSDQWQSILVDPVDLSKPKNYYLAIWDRTENVRIGDGPNGAIVNAFGTRMGCENSDECIAPILMSSPRITDLRNGTYAINVDLGGINGELYAVDKTGHAISTSSSVCLTNNSGDNGKTRAQFELIYPIDTKYAIEVKVEDSATCTNPKNQADCYSTIVAPSIQPLIVECPISTSKIYPSFDDVPAPDYNAIKIISTCGTRDYTISHGDIIHQKGPQVYEIERVFSVHSSCHIPGEMDDQYVACSVFFQVEFDFIPYTESCGLACNSNGVNIGVDEQCSALISPSILLEGDVRDCLDQYYVVLSDPQNNNALIPNPIGREYTGKTIQAQVFQLGSSADNSCWGTITIEDKKPPVIICPEIDTISCHLPDPIKDLSAWVQDACSSFTIEKLDIDIEEFDCRDNSNLRGKKTTTYVAIDEYGNRSRPCEVTLVYKAFDLANIQFPTDRNISCIDIANYDIDNDGTPDPEMIGYPTFQNHPINVSSGHCSLQMDFEDEIIPQCGQTYKILRKWTILDWCKPTNDASNNPYIGFQIIQVVDEVGPTITCTDEIKVIQTDGQICGLSRLKLDVPQLSLVCGEDNFSFAFGHKLIAENESPYDNFTEANVYVENGEYWVDDMPVGRHWIICTAYDECGKEASCYYEVHIEDHNAPIPVCEENNSITLSSDGHAIVNAESFDNGSFDLCSDVELSIKRLSPSDCIDSIVGFAPFINFCCLDAGSRHQVMLQVKDISGNTNTCTVQVSVKEHVSPNFKTVPPDHKIYCHEDLDVLDTGKPTIEEDCAIYTIDYEDQYATNQCKVGKIIRTWRLTNRQGLLLNSYDQLIEVLIENPFEFDPSIWPKDYSSSSDCSLGSVSPEITGELNLDTLDTGCQLLAINYDDEEFLSDQDACTKILRKWTVIDWCQYNEEMSTSANVGFWSYTQKIEFINDIPPTFESNCMIREFNGPTGDCSYSVELTANVADDCTPLNRLNVQYHIEFQNGETASGQGIKFASTSVPSGTHSIEWIAEDQCGNRSSCRDTFQIEDTVPPSAYCLGELTTVISSSSKDVEVWAIDFNLSSEDNCTTNQLSFRMRRSGTQDSLQRFLTFDCDDIGLQEVDIWVFDEDDNADFCTTIIDIQANQACNDGTNVGSSNITGSITTSSNQVIEDVALELYQLSTDTYYQGFTDAEGKFRFEGMPSNDNYQLSASKDENPLNGVSTLDLVLIQNHILGNIPFDDPYKIIASDINNNGSLSAADIVVLRQVLLGLIEDFPNNTSWRFADADQRFLDPSSPWPFAEFIDIFDLNQINASEDFIGIKVGDVNESANTTSNLSNKLEIRDNQYVRMVQSNSEIQNDIVKVALEIKYNSSIRGIQFATSFDQNNYELIYVESSLDNFSDDNYSIRNGELAVSWNHMDPQDLNQVELFELQFKVKNNRADKEIALTLVKDRLQAEIYNSNYAELPILLEKVQKNDMDNVKVGQNPFRDHTTIRVNAESFDHNAEFLFVDWNGKLIFNKVLEKGKSHDITINSTQLSGPGVYVCKIVAGDKIATRKIIYTR